MLALFPWETRPTPCDPSPMAWVWKFSGTTQRNITTKRTAFKTSWILIRIYTIFSKYDLELVDTVVS